MPEGKQIVILGDREDRDEINLGDRAMGAGLHARLGHCDGLQVVRTPWKSFPFYTMGRFRREARRHGEDAVPERWIARTRERAGTRSSFEPWLARVLDARLFRGNGIVGRLETRVRNRVGLSVIDAARPRLLRNRRARGFVNAVRESDAAVFVGGGLFADHLLKYLPAFVHEIRLAAEFSPAVAVVSHSVTVTDPAAMRLIGGLRDCVAVHMVRDSYSADRLREMGTPDERIMVSVDTAFGIPLPAEAESDELARRESIRAGTVGICVRGDRRVDVDSWARFITDLHAGGARDVRLFHTCRAHDRSLHRKLAATSPAESLAEFHNYPRLIALLRSFDAVITDRYHATIFSILAGTPVLPLESSTRKTVGLFEHFDYPFAVRPQMGSATREETTAAARSLLSQRDRVAVDLRAVRDRLRQKLARDIDTLWGRLNLQVP